MSPASALGAFAGRSELGRSELGRSELGRSELGRSELRGSELAGPNWAGPGWNGPGCRPVGLAGLRRRWPGPGRWGQSAGLSRARRRLQFRQAVRVVYPSGHEEAACPLRQRIAVDEVPERLAMAAHVEVGQLVH